MAKLSFGAYLLHPLVINLWFLNTTTKVLWLALPLVCFGVVGRVQGGEGLGRVGSGWVGFRGGWGGLSWTDRRDLSAAPSGRQPLVPEYHPFGTISCLALHLLWSRWPAVGAGGDGLGWIGVIWVGLRPGGWFGVGYMFAAVLDYVPFIVSASPLY